MGQLLNEVKGQSGLVEVSIQNYQLKLIKMIKYNVADDGSAVKTETFDDGKPEKHIALTSEEYKAEMGIVEEELTGGDSEIVEAPKRGRKKLPTDKQNND